MPNPGNRDEDEKDSQDKVESFDESDEMDDDIVVITDEEGKSYNCMVLAVMEVDGREYAMLSPVEGLEGEEGDDVELFLFTYDQDEENDQETFGPIDDDATYEKVREAFAELMEQSDEDDEDEGEDEDEDEDEEEGSEAKE